MKAIHKTRLRKAAKTSGYLAAIGLLTLTQPLSAVFATEVTGGEASVPGYLSQGATSIDVALTDRATFDIQAGTNTATVTPIEVTNNLTSVGIAVSGIRATAADGFTIREYGWNFKGSSVDSRNFSVAYDDNGLGTTGGERNLSGTGTHLTDGIAAEESKTYTLTGESSAYSTAVTAQDNTQIANIIFTVGMQTEKSINVTIENSQGTDLNGSATAIVGTQKEDLLYSLEQDGRFNISADDVDLLIDVDADSFEDWATATFEVSDYADPGDTAIVLHYDETTKQWEYIGTQTVNENGEVTMTFTSFSPVAFVFQKKPITLSMWASGSSINVKLKKLAGNSSATYYSGDNTITSFEKANNLPEGFTPSNDNTISVNNSEYPTYVWFDSESGTMYYYTEAKKVVLSSDSSYTFNAFSKLTGITGTAIWDTSNVTVMSSMFGDAGYNATTFSLDLSGWDTSNVISMFNMFSRAGYNATTWSVIGLSDWNTSSVRDTGMYGMFDRAGVFATTWSVGNLSGWDTSNVTSMARMFSSAGQHASSWNIGDLSGWNVSNVTDMDNMFSSAGYYATKFNLELSSWNTSKVTSMGNMFSYTGYNATSWSVGDLSNWNTSNVMSMDSMFRNAGFSATNFNLNLSAWNTSNVTSMKYMFDGAGFYATTWSVTIPASNGANIDPIANTTSTVYGNSSSVSIGAPSWFRGTRSFTLAQ